MLLPGRGRRPRRGSLNMSRDKYPVTVELSEGTLSTWVNFYEYGSWEDHGGREPGDATTYEDARQAMVGGAEQVVDTFQEAQ